MRFAILALLCVSAVLIGCQESKSKSTTLSVKDTPAKTDEDQTHYEAFRSGFFQIDNAVGSLEDALTLTKPLAEKAGGEAKGALLDAADMLDGAGATLSDANVEAPSLEEFKSQFAVYDDRRIKGINAATDAYQETKHARGILDDLSANAPKSFLASLKLIAAKTDEAIDQISEAIVSLGGEVPKEVELDPDDEAVAPVAEVPPAKKDATSPQKGR